MVKQNVKLVSVQGDQEDFSDLIGTSGQLYLDRGAERYKADGGDSIRLVRKRVTQDDRVAKVSTAFGNTFTFKRL